MNPLFDDNVIEGDNIVTNQDLSYKWTKFCDITF